MALRSILTALAVVLVSSCGVGGSSGSQSNSGPGYVKLEEFQSPNGSMVVVFCRGGHKYYEYAYKGLQIIENHRECANK